ncbi:hypothetical protein BJY00DRAFT_58501 [Aspergillus carlsbadensis]|nr:hypothetical protein BJY00DRAFT_58501 [Aspergillus carlsbadensis]
MPIRKNIRRLFGRDASEEEEHGGDEEHEQEESEESGSPDTPSPATAAQLKSWKDSPPSQLFAENIDEPRTPSAKSLWTDAYGQLVDEAPELVKALEADLLQSQSQNQQSAQEVEESTTEQRLQNLVQQRLVDVEASRAGFTVGGKRVMVREQAGKIIHAIVSVKEFISLAVSVEPHASLAWAGVLVFLDPLTNTITQHEEAIKGLEFISTLLIRYRLTEATHADAYNNDFHANSIQSRVELGASLRAKTVNLYAEVLRYQIRLAKQYARSSFFRFIKDLAVPDDWKGIVSTITELDETISQQLSALGNHTLSEVDKKMEKLHEMMAISLRLATENRDHARTEKQKKLLDDLSHTDDAVFGLREDRDKPRCLEGTQVSTLNRIQEWSEDPDGRSVLWLQGVAGTGKSTISRTFAAALGDHKRLVSGTRLPDSIRLGASFFFVNTNEDRNSVSTVFPTIARSIARVVPDLEPYLFAALEENEDIHTQTLANQLKKLILDPLRRVQSESPLGLTLIVIIDALDECKPMSDGRKLLSLLGSTKQLQATGLRFFITSRPDPQLRAELDARARKYIQNEILEKIHEAGSDSPDDITLYLRHELGRIRNERAIVGDWPGDANIAKLAHKAQGLFIFASTACRFLNEASRLAGKTLLDSRLAMLLSDKTAGQAPLNGLDQIYADILRDSVFEDGVLDEEKDILAELFKRVVGSIVMVFEPLSLQAISGLSSTPIQDVKETLACLHSVLAFPRDESAPVLLLHLSFREFLLDGERCRDEYFHVDELASHAMLFQDCLGVMSSLLWQNLCGLEPSTYLSDVDPVHISELIPAHLQYACRYWVDHLEKAQVEPYDGGSEHQFLQTHLLHWLEVMALTDRVHEAVRAINELWVYLSQLPATKTTQIRGLVQDARRFLLKFRQVIKNVPLQIYAYCAVFSPPASILRTTFQDCYSKSLPTVVGQDEEWDPLLLTIRKGWGTPAVSPDGSMLATCGISIWDTKTGNLINEMKYPDDLQEMDDDDPHPLDNKITEVAFSTDGKTLLSVREDGTIGRWEAATGRLLQLIECPSEHRAGWTMFSQDRKMLVMMRESGNTRLLVFVNVTTGSTLRKNTSQLDGCYAADLSPDGAILATLAPDNVVRLWDTSTGELAKELHEQAPDAYPTRVRFSPDGALLAACWDKSIIIWDMATGGLLRQLDNPIGQAEEGFEPPVDMRCSSLGGVLAATYRDFVCVWRLHDGMLLWKAEIRSRRLHLSPDGKLLTSVGDGGPILIWETESGAVVKSLNTDVLVHDALFFPDGQVLASLTWETLQLWDLTVQSSSRNVTPIRPFEFKGVKLTPDGSRVLTAGHSGVSLWDVRSCERVREYPCAVIIPNVLMFSPDGRYLATNGENEQDVVLHDAAALEALSVYAVRDGFQVGAAAFSPDSRLLVASAQKKSSNQVDMPPREEDEDDIEHGVLVWDVVAGKFLHELVGHTRRITALVFSPKSDLLVAVATDQTIRVWDMSTGKVRKLIKRHNVGIVAVAFSPDGLVFATAGSDRVLRLWNTTKGKLIRETNPPDDLYRRWKQLAFSPDGRLLVAYDKETIHLFDPPTGQLLVPENEMTTDTREMVQFDDIQWSADGRVLHGVVGGISLEYLLPDRANAGTLAKGLFIDWNWVVKGTEKVLLLPAGYRPACVAAQDGLLVVATFYGRLLMFKFD